MKPDHSPSKLKEMVNDCYVKPQLNQPTKQWSLNVIHSNLLANVLWHHQINNRCNTLSETFLFQIGISVLKIVIWASSWDYDTYHIGDQQRLRRACAVSPEPLLFAHMKYGSRRRVRPKITKSSLTGWLRMRIWRISLLRTKSTITSWHGSFGDVSSQKLHYTALLTCHHKTKFSTLNLTVYLPKQRLVKLSPYVCCYQSCCYCFVVLLWR